jgi:hypothetical protein
MLLASVGQKYLLAGSRGESICQYKCVCPFVGTYPNMSTADDLFAAMRARRRFGPSRSRICRKGTGFPVQRAAIFIEPRQSRACQMPVYQA